MYRCTSYNNDLPKETFISALYVNVFWFVFFFPWWSAVRAFEEQKPATRGFLGVLAVLAFLLFQKTEHFVIRIFTVHVIAMFLSILDFFPWWSAVPAFV